MGETPQDLSSLYATGAAPDGKGSWNGMLVYAADPKTGKPLIDAGADVKHNAASLTKIMTFYVALDAMKDGRIKPDQIITINSHDVAATVPNTNVIKGEKLTMKEALGAMMTASDNGVAVAISEAVGGDFVKAMNEKAKVLGLSDNTKFYNVNGLPDTAHPHSKVPQNTTTPRDMATMITRLNADYPEAAREYMGQNSVQYGPRHTAYPAHHFLEDPELPLQLPKGYQVIAKTGYTKEADHNIVSMVTAPDGKQLTVVVMGADWSDAQKAKAAGMPDAILPKPGQTVIGSAVRDALVGRITDKLLPKGEHSALSFASMLDLSIPAANATEISPHPVPHIRYRIEPPEVKAAHNTPVEHKDAKGPHRHPHPKSTAELATPEIPLSGDHKALLADARQQFSDALKTGGTPSAPTGKSGGRLELG